ncbi:venom protease-like [Macrosteles quadrilineatus]|uniref:venom protease-like n=1 Tax=Macrosteles quadrilineatus TaxID=74068 RepID=UPI0023E17181|nr:venom protease-like [Macrosteles quadrilineatus]
MELFLLLVILVQWEGSISFKIPISRCQIQNGFHGYCRPLEECSGVNMFEVSNCTTGLVCCTSGEISRKMCHEYSQFVYDSDSAVSLMAHTLSPAKEDTCAIVAVPLIVGGEKARSKEFPHQAVLGYGDPSDPKTLWECGGSLISDLFILTAAHCALPHHRPRFVRLGIINLKLDLDNEQIYPVKDIFIHPNYNKIQRTHDIALVRLSRNVDFTPYVRPACIDYSGVIAENRAIATGFGLIGHAGEQSMDLLKVTLDILEKKVCHHTVKRNMKKGLYNSQICAGYIAGGKDTCQGDSGGPLQTIKKVPYCMYNIIGLTSFGSMCGFQHSPAVYTRVWSFVPWIETLVWPDENNN